MAKNDALENIEIAMAGAALKESVVKDAGKRAKVTQKEGSHPVSLKKFPKEWAERIGNFHAGALSDYILIAIAEKMKRDGI